jgi:hypothetical protein
MTCGDFDHFWQREVEVLDSAGKRVLRRSEEILIERQRNDPGSVLPAPFRCWRNFAIDIPPRGCLNGTFSSADPDLTRDLNQYYRFEPGQYSLVGPRKEAAEQSLPTVFEQRFILSITVLKP